MKAIILSAGQGRRLLPFTAEIPKCALQIGGRSLLEWQITQLSTCGVNQVTVVMGFGADKVEQLVLSHHRPDPIHTLYNPFFAMSDNLVSCWLARHLMTGNFILLNGDVLFEAAIVERLLSAPSRPVTLVTDRKVAYDADDMKVRLDGHRVLRVGKTLKPEQFHAESIGMMLFRGSGPSLFSDAVERALRKPEALKQWYLSVIDEMARAGLVWSCPIHGLGWTEVDCAADLEEAEKLVTSWHTRSQGRLETGSRQDATCAENSGNPPSFKTASARQCSELVPSRSLYPRPMPPQERGA